MVNCAWNHKNFTYQGPWVITLLNSKGNEKDKLVEKEES